MTDELSFKFSVAIPLYNKAKFVQQTIAFVQAQTLAPTEIIIVDDGSVDDSVARVRAINDPRIRLVRQPNAGPGPARNRAISECKNEWVALLDADDWWMENHLSTFAEMATAFPQADMLASSIRRVTPGSSLPEASSQPTNGYVANYFNERIKREITSSSTVAIRRQAFLATHGFGEIWPGEDSEFWARFTLDHIMVASRKVTACYVINTGGIMQSGTSNRHDRRSIHDTSTVALLNRALSDERYAHLHHDIAALREYLILSGAKRALYRGEPMTARTILGHAKHRYRWPAMLYLALAYLPQSVAQTGIRAVSAMKQMRN